ncbi:retropepsin-like aspartic protease family protein [Frigidibacter sp. MR17.24]|uniref:retropepsin-like aspartic protease family protein n=1 Tax=Frigidibacter sp. MR17.24 TaxID=3127345 RepID=UPI003012A22B
MLSPDDTARLIYLGLLALAVGGAVFAMLRANFGRVMAQALTWALLFLGVIAAHGLWQDIRQDVMPRQAVFDAGARIAVPVSPDGHYYLTLELNGVPVRMVVDTGATDMVLARADAARAGIDTQGLAYIGRATTANGRVATAPVRIDSVVLGGVEDRRVRATVTDGALEDSLLGMGYLSRFSSLEIRGGELVLTR